MSFCFHLDLVLAVHIKSLTDYPHIGYSVFGVRYSVFFLIPNMRKVSKVYLDAPSEFRAARLAHILLE